MSWFRKKSQSEDEPVQDTSVEVTSDTGKEKEETLTTGNIWVDELFSSPYTCSHNFHYLDLYLKFLFQLTI